MVNRLIQSRKVLVVLGIVAVNALLFLKYAWNEAEPGSHPDPVLELRQPRQVEDTQLHTQHAVYAESNAGFANPPVIIYNRVPKTGSTTFANIAYALAKSNNFNMLHINVTYKNLHYLNILDQQRLARNISTWVDMYPAIYHGHVYYLDFTRFGFNNPIYINIVRDPIERLISYYYFLRYGDDYRPNLKRSKAKDNTTLDECLKNQLYSCDLVKVLWVQIPFFCGQSVQCLKPNRWALEQAKANLVTKYLMVGLTEQLGEFIALLEVLLPHYFSGAYDLYTKSELGHLRRTKEKITPTEETLRIIRASEIYQLEQEFYEFAKEHFEFHKLRALQIDKQGRAKVNPIGFKYEKIVTSGTRG